MYVLITLSPKNVLQLILIKLQLNVFTKFSTVSEK